MPILVIEVNIKYYLQLSGKTPTLILQMHWFRKYKCNECPYTAPIPALIKKHARSVHEKIKDHKCDECGKSFVAKLKLQLHIKAIHDKIKDQFCDQCDYVTSYPDELRKHKILIHSEDRGDGLECPECGMMLASKGSLRQHERFVHQKVRDVSCLLCLEKFSTTGKPLNRTLSTLHVIKMYYLIHI